MSLATRLLALAGALGADVKALTLATTASRQRWRTEATNSVPPIAATTAPQYYAGYGPNMNLAYVSTAGDGSTMTYRADICPGTWTMRYWYMKLNNLGIGKIEYSTDEGASWTVAHAGLDMYSAAAVYALFVDVTGIVVPAGKYTILVKVTAVGKNASSSAYIVMFGGAYFTRTA